MEKTTNLQQPTLERAYHILKKFSVFDSVENQTNILNEMLIDSLMDSYEGMDTEKKEEFHALVTFYKGILKEVKTWEDERQASIQMQVSTSDIAPVDEA